MRLEDFQRQELRSLLKRWGDWIERHDLDDSLPHQSSHTLIYADQPAGHKILCAEMSRAVWLINYHIEHLPQQYSDALLIGYALNLKEKGGYWSLEEKARKLKISPMGLRVRISRAVGVLHRKVFQLTDRKETVTYMQPCEAVT